MPPDETQAPVMVITKPPCVTDPSGQTGPTSSDPNAPNDPDNPAGSGDDPVIVQPSDDFGSAFEGIFAKGEDEVNRGENYYQSHDVCIKVSEVNTTLQQIPKKGATKYETTRVRYYLADVYVRNVENLFTAYSVGKNVPFDSLLSGTDAIFALNGNVFNSGSASKEIIVRNGNVIRCQDYISSDICVLYWDGTMETVTPAEFDWDKIVAKAPIRYGASVPSCCMTTEVPFRRSAVRSGGSIRERRSAMSSRGIMSCLPCMAIAVTGRLKAAMG